MFSLFFFSLNIIKYLTFKFNKTLFKKKNLNFYFDFPIELNKRV